MRVTIRAFINFLIIFCLTLYFGEAALFEHLFPTFIGISSMVQFAFLALLISHYVSWWNSFLDSLAGASLPASQSFHSQSLGAILNIIVTLICIVPFLGLSGFDGVFALFGICLLACNFGVLRILSLYRLKAEYFFSIPDPDMRKQQEQKADTRKGGGVFARESLLYIGVSMIYLLYASWIFWRPLWRFVDVELDKIHPATIVILCTPFVSLLSPRFILRAYQFRDMFFHGNMGWDKSLKATIVAGFLNVLLMSFFPLNSLFQIIPMESDLAWVGISLFFSSVGILCVLLTYQKTHTVISWTGLKIVPEELNQ